MQGGNLDWSSCKRTRYNMIVAFIIAQRLIHLSTRRSLVTNQFNSIITEQFLTSESYIENMPLKTRVPVVRQLQRVSLSSALADNICCHNSSQKIDHASWKVHIRYSLSFVIFVNSCEPPAKTILRAWSGICQLKRKKYISLRLHQLSPQ